MHLGDFTLTPRVLSICGLALPIGLLSALAAWCLLRLIGLVTNLLFYGRAVTSLVAPGAGPHSWLVILCLPVAGGLAVGLMARFGSEKIRGHGMPEAIEAILTRGSRVEPRVAILKPISAAISIGSGGPFGAEGPIIMTGGALGSVLAQMLELTADERKTLLVAGAAGGMAATFDAPLASVLLAVELLLFEWRPRSMLPVATAVAVATVARLHLLGSSAVFLVPGGHLHFTVGVYACCALIGAATGALGALLTALVYAAEDGFKRLPIHWMWWPAIGGLVIGLGGIAEPRALGVGYDVIRELLTGRAAMSLIVGIFIVKSLIWSLSLGSGTSGGVLAPMFMIGGAFGALLAPLLPHVAPGFWPLICLAGVIGGVMRAPFTAVVFAAELTGRWSAVLPLLIGASGAYLFTALVLKRSVLTEKVARRGFHLTREYDVDPLAVLFVREAMDTDEILAYDTADRLGDVLADFRRHSPDLTSTAHRQRIYPVTGGDGSLAGIVTRRDLLRAALLDGGQADGMTVAEVMSDPVAHAHPDETLREVAYRMAEHGVTRMPVLSRGPRRELVGVITLPALLEGRLRDLQEERDSERILRIAHLEPWRRTGRPTRPPALPGRSAGDR